MPQGKGRPGSTLKAQERKNIRSIRIGAKLSVAQDLMSMAKGHAIGRAGQEANRILQRKAKADPVRGTNHHDALTGRPLRKKVKVRRKGGK